MAGENGRGGGGRGRGSGGGGGGRNKSGGGRGRGSGGQGRSGGGKGRGGGGRGGQGGQQARKPAEATLAPKKGKAFSTPYDVPNVGAIAPFELFCAVLLGVMPDGSYRQSNNPNVGEVAKRCGRHPGDLKALIKAYGMTQESLSSVHFDVSLARLDIQVAPEGMDRRELARGLYDEFLELNECLVEAERAFAAGEVVLPEREVQQSADAPNNDDDAPRRGGRGRGRRNAPRDDDRRAPRGDNRDVDREASQDTPRDEAREISRDDNQTAPKAGAPVDVTPKADAEPSVEAPPRKPRRKPKPRVSKAQAEKPDSASPSTEAAAPAPIADGGDESPRPVRPARRTPVRRGG